MTITVAIPSYNKDKYIERCIKSVLQQKPFANEILVIDNCSSDRTFEIAKQFEPEIQCVRNSTNLGMAGNWNRCIELCQSDLLLILHADDELLPGALKAYLNFFEQHPNLGFAHADFYYIEDGNINSKQFMDTRVLEIAKAGLEAMSFPKGYACSTIVVPKKVYRQVGIFMESMSPDLEMLLRIAAHHDVGQIHQATANIHINSESVGRRSSIDRTPKEIEADTDNLNAKIIAYFPPEMQGKLKEDARASTAGLLVQVFGRNLKAGNYKKAFQALTRALFKYRGFRPFVKVFAAYFKHKWTVWLASRKQSLS